MTTLHCPLCGLRFRYASELDEHAREHCVPHEMHLPPHRERRAWGAHAPHADQDAGAGPEVGADPGSSADPQSSTALR